MTSTNDPSTHHAGDRRRDHGPDGHERDQQDEAEAIVDEEAAEIDPRDPEAPEQIAELVDDSAALGLDTPDPSEVDPPDPES
jgi:hypothetical protein